MGTTIGGHIYVEVPDQSSSPETLMDGTTQMDGTATMQGTWAPIDLGLQPYVAGQQPWILLSALGLNGKVATNIRVYVSSYSDTIDLPLVRAGLMGATPSVVVTVPAQTTTKPSSASNITPFLVTGITGSVGAAVAVGGKLRRPIGVTVDLTGLPTGTPTDWAYQLLGFVNGDLTTAPVLASGYMTVDGLIPAGPDGISDPHTFAPEEPTDITSITIYAVAGLIAGSRLPGARGTYQTSTSFTANNIVPGITASCVVSIGTVAGVVDMTAAMLSSTSAEFHIDPATGLFAMNQVDFTKATNFSSQFAISGAQMHVVSLAADVIVSGILQVGGGGSKMSIMRNFDTSNNLIGWVGDDTSGSGFVGAWFKRLLIGGTSPSTAKIVADSAGNVAISGTLISGNIAGNAASITGTLSASQISAGTVTAAVSLNAPTLNITGSGFTINLSSSGFTYTRGTGTVVIAGSIGPYLYVYDSSTGSQVSLSPLSINCHDVFGSGANAGMSADLLALNDTGGLFCNLTHAGFTRVNGAAPFTGTLAAALAAGKSVQGGIIMN